MLEAAPRASGCRATAMPAEQALRDGAGDERHVTDDILPSGPLWSLWLEFLDIFFETEELGTPLNHYFYP